MARTKIEFNVDKIKEIINNLESTQTFNNLSALYQAVALAYNAELNPETILTPSIVMLRIKDAAITVKTVAGKRGRQAGCAPIPRSDAPRITRAEKFAKPNIIVRLNVIADWNSKNISKTLSERMVKGSMSAAVKLKCLGCVETKKDIRDCSTSVCPLWAFRPYQKDDNDDEETETESVAA